MEEQEFWLRLREIIREEVKRELGEREEQPESWEGTEALCKRLGITKPTLYNWKKRPETKELIAANYRKLGGKVEWNYGGMMELLKRRGDLFGGGRDYEYKKAQEQRERNRERLEAFRRQLGMEGESAEK